MDPLQILILIALGVLFAIWVLLPLVPSVLICKLFPDTPITVSGPLAGLTVKAGGAFGAYFIIIVVTLPLAQYAWNLIGNWNRPYWRVTGEIKLFEADGKPNSSDDLFKQHSVVAVPNLLRIENFTADFKVVEIEGDLPKIIIQIPGFPKYVIEKTTLEKNKTSKKTIELKDPIEIRKEFSPATSLPVAERQIRPGLGLPISSAN